MRGAGSNPVRDIFWMFFLLWFLFSAPISFPVLSFLAFSSVQPLFCSFSPPLIPSLLASSSSFPFPWRLTFLPFLLECPQLLTRSSLPSLPSPPHFRLLRSYSGFAFPVRFSPLLFFPLVPFPPPGRSRMASCLDRSVGSLFPFTSLLTKLRQNSVA